VDGARQSEGRTAKPLPCGFGEAHGKEDVASWALPCKFCRAASHGKAFAVLILAFAVHLPRTAT
jgi:hypothetical protein